MSQAVKRKNLHVILTYSKEVENENIEEDIIQYLSKLQSKEKGKLEYCYKINPILDKRPAIHILLKLPERINETELIKLWDKGMAKTAILEEFDRRAMEFYLSNFKKISRGFK
jgi:hypothetical protein